MSQWWEHAVVYQVYVRSFSDADGDGLGDLRGLRSRLDHLSWLGVDAIWLNPVYPSPDHDHGYDVSDYTDIDPRFGSLDELDALLADCHDRGMRVIMDIVPNHVSSEHEWFTRATASRDAPERDLFVFRDPAPDGGPPNNWRSVFGGPAWTLHEPTGQYYLHLFAPEQPDLNWRNPAVHAEFERILRFWLDRGVDGFRIDVAHSLYKDELLRDNPDPERRQFGTPYMSLEQPHCFDQPEVHDVWRAWRRVFDAYGPDRVTVGEVFLYDPERVALYLRPDELHLAFNFLLLAMPFEAERYREAIDMTFAAYSEHGSPSTWVLSNHDVRRHVTRFGGGELGRRRGLAATVFALGLPGVAFLYQGEELGLEEVDVPPEARQDPIERLTEGHRSGRDGCRVPLPWTSEPPGYGFTSGHPWLPFPGAWGERSVEAMRMDEGSTLHVYREALRARRSLSDMGGAGFEWTEAPDGCLAFRRGGVVVALNTADAPATLPVTGELALASAPDVRMGAGLQLPPATAAWVVVSR
ncbi:MAG TPA: glycoside hydrolase family 13 protein [Actinomycetota bacterium]|nr:glycoside hydrolase family 13 protein [Actinomycetota bacterium]